MRRLLTFAGPAAFAAATVLFASSSFAVNVDPLALNPITITHISQMGLPDSVTNPNAAAMPFHTDFNGNGQFSQAAGFAADAATPFFFGIRIGAGTGIDQFDPANALGAAPSSLIISWDVFYDFPGGFFNPWVQGVALPFLSFAGPGDTVSISVTGTFTDFAGGVGPGVVIGPGINVGFVNAGGGLIGGTLFQSRLANAPILPGDLVEFTGSLTFSADDPDCTAGNVSSFFDVFAEVSPSCAGIFMTQDSVTGQIPEPPAFVLLLAGLLLLAAGAPRHPVSGSGRLR